MGGHNACIPCACPTGSNTHAANRNFRLMDQTASISSVQPPPHYPTPAAKCADLVVHVVGLTLALVGGIVLLALAVQAHSISKAVGVSIYAVGLLAMLAFSTAYNFAKPAYRPLLRRLDHAGIFLM